jgi:hypothetical protein
VVIALVLALSVAVVGLYAVGLPWASRDATVKPAGLNNDGTVNVFDLSTLLSKWN